MTFAPRACASEMIDLPLPGSRSTSRMTFAPFVSACSAWVRCVPGSPWALVIVCLIPAAVKAWSRYLRSNCSQRTDDCVSGRSTATLPALAPPLVLAAPPLVELLLLLDEPQPAATSATVTARAHRPHHIFFGTATSSWFCGPCLCCPSGTTSLPCESKLLARLTSPPPRELLRRTRGRSGLRQESVPPAARRARRMRPARPWRRRRPPGSHSGGSTRASERAPARPRRRPCPRSRCARG